MHLADDHAFGAIDDKGAVGGHQGHVAHIDVLFFDIADRLDARVFLNIKNGQAQRDFQRCGKGNAALLAFFNIVFRLFEFIGQKVQNGATRKIRNRESRHQNVLQTPTFALGDRYIHLKEIIVGATLHLDQIGHFCNFGDTSKTFAYLFAAGKALAWVDADRCAVGRHACPSKLCSV